MPYTPRPVPASLDDTRALQQYLTSELRAIAEAVAAPTPTFLQFQTIDIEPPKPLDGQMVYAPAQTGFWNPGAGPGLYFYHQNKWQLVDIAKGFGGMFTIAANPTQIIDQTPTILEVFDTEAPTAPAAPYKVTVDLTAGVKSLSNVDPGLWRIILSGSLDIPSAQVLIFALFENGVSVAEVIIDVPNQLDNRDLHFEGTFTITAGTTYDIRVSNLAPQPVTVTFPRMQFQIEQMQSARL